MTVNQAAEIAGITTSGIRKAMRRGDLPYSELVGVKVITRVDFQKYRDSVKLGRKPGKPKTETEQP